MTVVGGEVTVVEGEVMFAQCSGPHEQGLELVGLKVTWLPTKGVRGNGPYSCGHSTVRERRVNTYYPLPPDHPCSTALSLLKYNTIHTTYSRNSTSTQGIPHTLSRIYVV